MNLIKEVLIQFILWLVPGLEYIPKEYDPEQEEDMFI